MSIHVRSIREGRLTLHPRITLAAAAVLGLLATTAACDAAATPGPAALSPAPATAHPQVTKADAEKQLAVYLDLNNRANASLDDTLLAQYETGASLVIDKAGYQSYRLAAKDPSEVKPFGVVDVSYFPVRSTAYPRLFLMKGQRRNLDGTTLQDGWNYWLFRQETADGPWLQFSSPVGDERDSAPQPDLGADAEGLVTEVPVDAGGLLIPPRDLAANYAARVLGKPLPAKEVQFVGLDKWPSNSAEERARMKRWAKETERAAPAAEYPTYALRTKDGGALVFTTISYQIHCKPLPGKGVTDSSGTGFLKQNTPYAGFMEKNYLLNLLAYVPPAGGSSGIRVLGTYSGILSASGA
jgi:hypothetical protein